MTLEEKNYGLSLKDWPEMKRLQLVSNLILHESIFGIEGLQEALEEVGLIEKGKIKCQSLDELLKELE